MMTAKPDRAGRTDRAHQAETAAPFVPDDPAETDLATLRHAAAGCQGCGLYRDATQTVFGAGDADARVVLIGETPGDQEDRRGEPFVGPAGRLLDRALEDAGIDRNRTYVTNAVKHFKFEQRPERGKRRLHKTPNRAEIVACRPWLEAELALLRPEILVCLGATAAKAILGSSFRVTKERGTPLPAKDLAYDTPVVATIHPSAVLRAEDRTDVYDGLVADLGVAAGLLTGR